MNLNAARRLRRLCLRFFNCRMADTEGVEPTYQPPKWRDFSEPCPMILFWATSWANLTQERTDALLLTTEVSGFRTHTRTVFFRERLLLALKGSGRFAATGSSLLCGFRQLSLLILVRSTVLGGLKGGLVVGIGIHHGVSPPLRRKLRQ